MRRLILKQVYVVSYFYIQVNTGESCQSAPWQGYNIVCFWRQFALDFSKSDKFVYRNVAKCDTVHHMETVYCLCDLLTASGNLV